MLPRSWIEKNFINTALCDKVRIVDFHQIEFLILTLINDTESSSESNLMEIFLKLRATENNKATL